jgi:hypothetical protein
MRTFTLPGRPGIKLLIGKKKPAGKSMITQAVVFRKKYYNEKTANDWIKKNNSLLKCRIKNPSDYFKVKDFKINSKAVDLYWQFHGAPPAKLKQKEFDFKGGLVRLGQAEGVLYKSNKYNNPNQPYIHAFDKPLPDLYSNINGNTLVIKGKFRIDQRGIVG